MDTLAIATLVVIFASIVIALLKKFSFSVLVVAACVIIFGMEFASVSIDSIVFVPSDLVHPSMIYTVLTSMYAHGSLQHLLFNMISLAFIGIVLEQRIGTKPFMLLYLLSGLFGSLAFALYYWNGDPVSALGASGAIMGVLGGFARLYPNERMMFIFIPYPIRIPYVVLIFVAMQFLFVFGGNVAWQAHLGGLAAGIVLAPLVVKVRKEGRVRKQVSVAGLRKLATTPELRAILAHIEQESVPDVRQAWVEHFMTKARCPICGSPIKLSGDMVKCSRGHIL